MPSAPGARAIGTHAIIGLLLMSWLPATARGSVKNIAGSVFWAGMVARPGDGTRFENGIKWRNGPLHEELRVNERFKDKVAVVTGENNGIGLAAARPFLREACPALTGEPGGEGRDLSNAHPTQGGES